ncbi:MAG TPA: bifunctional [glutamate--ammonia ligase]-adenylyl-L-tyrosine phosphorylase/[glutamate--ammonia-ligase] adenylyltransferase [Novimethylophilus sp.]|jgi:glutamate-ammonia-ligase adenylyltransferase|uniref:bifunctional [glutamate--ammonia ligase]-adenylyl-L-tyrosine phosphorylase/[glutamate--ammonia-ligase] adenylyltransferase n=1 Tax=Novimethylophilus sp. TaxID=2137426 RepID=UPI002F3F34B6
MPAPSENSFQQLLQHTRNCSPFVARLLDADAELLEPLLAHVHEPWDEPAMRSFLSSFAIADEASLKRILRHLRKHVMLRLIARDLNGLADLAEVVETCTALAEVAVGFALGQLHHWQAELYGLPVDEYGAPQALVVVGMGKLGGRELNVSSDIDLIFAYAQDGATDGARSISNHEYFSRLGKRLISAIGEITADGFVFRVDMRLRPYGDSGPLVGSYAALEEYYQTQGREWERYAWIKGRVIYGPGEELEALLKPFVFRKYLDYGAIASMRDLKVQIEREVARRDMHDNIKLGPGGIREIEFIAQVFQLIRGGKDRELQIRPTLQVLERLARKGLLSADTVNELSEAYVFLRNLEHRLQYLQDAQTQMLPPDDDSRARLAAGMNFPDWAGLEQALMRHRGNVERYFSQVFEEAGNGEGHSLDALWLGQQPAAAAQQQLDALGYREAAETLQRLKQLRVSTRYLQLPQQSRERFDTLMPQLIQAAGRQSAPDVALARAMSLFEAICRRANYLALLAEYPYALELVCRLCGASPWLAAYLTQHPILLDELLDTRNLYAPPDFAALAAELEATLADCGGDVERKLDALRHFKHAQTFRFAAQDLVGELPLETLSDYLSALADLMLDAVIRHAWPGLRSRHRETPLFAIIGYGKLGGKELGYSSDLDLVFLYDDEANDAGAVYARFGQRINNWLNSLTPAGQLYETDLRLRPDGASGLLVSSVAAFAEYQRGKAWTWEHQALTRARFCAGDAAIGRAFDQIRQQVLSQPRDLAKLREEVIAMRQKMLDGHPNDTELFDLKHDCGGIVDVEFIVQFLVLAHARSHAELAANTGNIALLKRAGALKLIPDWLAAAVADAYRAYRKEQHALRLQGLERARVPSAAYAGQRAAVTALWQEVFQPRAMPKAGAS